MKFVRGGGGTREAQWIEPLVGKPFKKMETALARQLQPKLKSLLLNKTLLAFGGKQPVVQQYF